MTQAIFFDFNGVIINDERIHLKAYREILAHEGVELSDADYFASLGMDDVAFVRAAFARGNKPLTDELMRGVIEREHAKHREMIKSDLPVAAGVVAFIKELAQHLARTALRRGRSERQKWRRHGLNCELPRSRRLECGDESHRHHLRALPEISAR